MCPPVPPPAIMSVLPISASLQQTIAEPAQLGVSGTLNLELRTKNRDGRQSSASQFAVRNAKCFIPLHGARNTLQASPRQRPVLHRSPARLAHSQPQLDCCERFRRIPSAIMLAISDDPP